MGDDHGIRLWDIASEGELLDLPGHNGIVRSIAYSPDGDSLASVGTDGTVRVWDLPSERQVRILRGHRTSTLAIDWHPDGSLIASGSRDGAVKIWDVHREPGPLPLPDECAGFVAWSPDATMLASKGLGGTQGEGGVLKVFDASTGAKVLEMAPSVDTVRPNLRSLDWSPNGDWIASGDRDGGVSVWSVSSAERVFHSRRHADPPPPNEWQHHSVVDWHPDVVDERLASGGVDGNVRIWNVRAGRELANLEGPSPIMAIAWSPNGEFLASANRHQAVTVWRTASVDKLRRLRAPSTPWYAQERSIAWSPDSKRLVAGSPEGVVVVWEIATGQVLFETQGHAALANTVAWSPDGARIVSGGEDHAVKIYDALTGQEIVGLRGHTYTIHDVAWSPDGRRLASAGRTVKIWDAPGYVETR